MLNHIMFLHDHEETLVEVKTWHKRCICYQATGRQGNFPSFGVLLTAWNMVLSVQYSPTITGKIYVKFKTCVKLIKFKKISVIMIWEIGLKLKVKFNKINT